MFFAREPITFPPELGLSLEKAFASTMQEHGKALRLLWPKLAKNRGQVREQESHYSFDKNEAAAYAHYYLPVNCLKPALVLEESFLLGTDPIPEGNAHWLDLGTGPGTAFWGLAWWFAQRGKALRFTGWDQSSTFTRIATELARSHPNKNAKAEFTAEKIDPVALIQKVRPTHVSFMNSLAEIYADPALRRAEIEKIINALGALSRSDGRPRFLLLLEPGSRESSRELAQLKDGWAAHNKVQVLLPCLDARPCGALANPQDWCHEEVGCHFPDWVNDLGAEAGMRKESLLFSYVWAQIGQRAPDFPQALRIVSQRMERKGQVECRLCTAQGKRMVRVQRSKSTEINESFFQSVRGDLWREAEIGEKGDLIVAQPIVGDQIQSIFS